MNRLNSYIPRNTYGIATAYRDGDIAALVAGVEVQDDGSLELSFPKANPFREGDAITIHLDNRTGVEHFDIELRVYRCSWKGRVVSVAKDGLRAVPEEYVLMYSNGATIEYMAPGFRYAEDRRPNVSIGNDPRTIPPLPDPKENANKLGVWITRGADRPHTTVMAFLSTPDDDIYVLSQRASHKSALIHRDPRCMFAIDHRANWHFEKHYDWNYSIVKAVATLVPPENPAFRSIQATFVEKNPWELPFFSDPTIELFHLRALEVMCPEKYARH